MPITIPDDLPARRSLEAEGVVVMREADAARQEIRPLRIGLLNLMPDKISTETQLARLLGATPLQIELTLVRITDHVARNTPADHLLGLAPPGWPLSICGRPLSGKGKRWDRCCAWSDAVICPAFDAAGTQPPAYMGVRGPGPDHPKRARSTVESPGCRSPVSPTVAPYSPSARPHVLAIVVSEAAAVGVL